MKIHLPYLKSRVFRNRAFATALFTLFFFINPLCLYSGETVLHRFHAEVPDLQLEDVLYLAAGIVLAQEGLSSTRKEGISDYILFTEYTAAAGKVDVRYSLFDPDNPGNALVVLECRLTIDYTLNEQIARAITEVLQKAAIESGPPEAEIGELLDLPLEETGNGTSHGSRDNGVSIREEEDDEPSARESLAVKFDSSVSTALVFLLGDITEYLHYSLAGLLSLGVTWSRKSWDITLGVRLSFNRAYNNPEMSGGPVYLSLSGLNLVAGTGTQGPYRLSAGISGGAALITVAGSGGSMTKTVPYFDAGVYTGILMGKHFSVEGGVSFLMVFDNDLLIMGISPVLTLSLEV